MPRIAHAASALRRPFLSQRARQQRQCPMQRFARNLVEYFNSPCPILCGAMPALPHVQQDLMHPLEQASGRASAVVARPQSASAPRMGRSVG